MSLKQLDNICSKHQLEFKFVDLDNRLDGLQKQLCLKCVSEKYSTNQSLVFIDEFMELFTKMKQTQYEQQKSQLQNQIKKYSNIQNSCQNFIKGIKISIDDLEKFINQKIQNLESQLKEFGNPQIVNINDEDIKSLAQNYQGNFLLEIPQSKPDTKQELEFISEIKQRLYLLINEKELQSAINEFDSVMDIEQDEKQIEGQPELNKNVNQKIRSLPIECSKHKENIVMFNLASNEKERLLCLECIPECNQQSLTNLEKANNQWLEYQGCVFENKRQINISRQQTQSKIKEILQKYQISSSDKQNELLRQSEKNFTKVKEEIQCLNKDFKRKSINQLDIEELYNATNLLSEVDKQKESNIYLNQLQDQDLIFYQQIFDNIKQLQEILNVCQKQLNEIIPNPLIINQSRPIIKIKDDQLKNENEKTKVRKENETQAESNPCFREKLYYDQLTQLKKKKIETTPLRFSQQFKHEKIQLSNDFQTAQLSSNDKQNLICLCDQAIPQIGTVAVEFKIKNMKILYVGVCLKDQINQNYEIKIQNIANRNKNQCYLLAQDGSQFFHQQDKQKNNFKFGINDIIRMEVNQQEKKITWCNKSQDNSFVTKEIPAADDLYFCFILQQENEVENLFYD